MIRYSSFNYVALLHGLLANVSVHQSREWGTIAAMVQWWPPWFIVFFLIDACLLRDLYDKHFTWQNLQKSYQFLQQPTTKINSQSASFLGSSQRLKPCQRAAADAPKTPPFQHFATNAPTLPLMPRKCNDPRMLPDGSSGDGRHRRWAAAACITIIGKDLFGTEARGCGVAGGRQQWRRRPKLTHLVGDASAVVLLKIGDGEDNNNDDNDDNNDDNDNNDNNNDNNDDNDDDDNNDDNDDNDDDDNNDDNDDDSLLSLSSSPLPTLRRMTVPALPTKRVSFGCPRHHCCPPAMPLPPASVQKNPLSMIVMCTAATHHRCQQLLLPSIAAAAFGQLSRVVTLSGHQRQCWGVGGGVSKLGYLWGVSSCALAWRQLLGRGGG